MGPKFYKKKFAKTVSPINEHAIYLIIVESPSKCEKIESYLGSQYCCIASKGHIRTIDGIKAIDVKGSFAPTFTLIKEKKDHVDWMRTIIDKFPRQNIIIASDDDREGEAIGWHICQVFDLPIDTTDRIIFHEVTQPALQESVAHPTKINLDRVHAQHARQVLDIIVGYKISPYLWKYMFNSKSNTLSAGRCQTPALRLVYDNEKGKKTEENNDTKYKVVGTFFSRHIPYELNVEFDQKEQVLDFLEKSININHELTIHDPKPSIREPPKPFSTSRLLQVSSNVLRISPKETMSLCQKLYESGHITYMRTESSQYSPLFLEKIGEHIGSHYGEKYIRDIRQIVSKDAGTPHEAVRITNIGMSSLTSSEPRLTSMYHLIWKNTIESCMAAAVFSNIKTTINAPNDHYYHHTVEIPVFLGWTACKKEAADSDQNKGRKIRSETEENGGSLHLYLTTIRGSFPVQWIDATLTVKNKHQHYSESTLIHKLEELGIGRPSTFASIVDTIVERGYVVRGDIEGARIQCEEYKLLGGIIENIVRERVFGNEKSKLIIQPTGTMTIEFLVKTFERLFSYSYTHSMEKELDLVSSGQEKDWTKICRGCLEEIAGLSKELKDLCKQTFPLDENHEIIFSPSGPVIKHKYMDDNHEAKCEFLPIKKDFDIEKAKRGEYTTVDQLLERKDNCLGEHDGTLVYVKTGKFGPYVEWGDKTHGISKLNKPIDKIELADVIPLLTKGSEPNVLRRLNEHMSVRKGKFGPYVFYQRPDMKKPEFFNLKTFNEGFFGCEAETLINWVLDKGR